MAFVTAAAATEDKAKTEAERKKAPLGPDHLPPTCSHDPAKPKRLGLADLRAAGQARREGRSTVTGIRGLAP
jgi:hypothetical protein